MPHITIVLLNANRMFLSDHMSFHRQHLRKGIPAIRVKRAVR